MCSESNMFFNNQKVKLWLGHLRKWSIFLLLGFFNVVSTIACPGECFCPSVTRYVHCSRKNLPFIPSGISNKTTHLYLNENRFQNSVLYRSNFTYLTALEQLFLINCGLEHISTGTFSDLKKLKWLDISKNRLKVLYDDTFRGLRLNHLFLNDNPGMEIRPNSFRGLQAMGLYIHNCAIANITVKQILPLHGSLKSLWMDGNKVEFFDEEWYSLFSSLSYIRLGNNPLHCNCEVQWLYKFYESHTETMFAGVDPPTCRTPPMLRGKKFNDLGVDDFRCQLPVFLKVDAIFEETSKLTCSAFGDPIPTIIWVKPDKSQQIFKHEDADTIHGGATNEALLYLRDPHAIENAKYKCIAQNPAGNVTFSLNVNWGTPFSRQIVQDPGIIDTPATEEIPSHPKYLNPNFDPHKSGGSNYTKGDEDKSQYIINANSQSSGISQSVSKTEDASEVSFSLVDIVGAVVGTFLLTLLACIIIVHIFHRHQERVLYRNQNGVNEKRTNNKNIVPESKNENVKMLQNNHHV